MDSEPKTNGALALWRSIAQTDEIVDFFTDMFDVMGIVIEETGEELTLRVGENKIHIDPGLPAKCDFLVPLKTENVTNMVSHAEDGSLGEYEAWRIASVLFTPLTRETLKNAVMSKSILRRLARIEDLVHVQLLGPESQHVASHTLVFASGQWLVIDGYTVRQEEFHDDRPGVRCLPEAGLQGDESEQHPGLDRFGRWYVKWRASASSKG